MKCESSAADPDFLTRSQGESSGRLSGSSDASIPTFCDAPKARAKAESRRRDVAVVKQRALTAVNPAWFICDCR